MPRFLKREKILQVFPEKWQAYELLKGMTVSPRLKPLKSSFKNCIELINHFFMCIGLFFPFEFLVIVSYYIANIQNICDTMLLY